MSSDQVSGRTGPNGQGSTFEVGALLSHTYEVKALLARGGMGEVYRTRHAEIGTEHAIKMIRPELAGDPKIVELFRREAATLRTVRDEAVVSYDGVLRDEAGRVYLIMEFVDGPSLTKRMQEKPLSADEVRRLLERLARGLAAAHERGVIHRDMSPDNVILGGGKLENAKIIDFGIAKLTDSTATTIIGDEFAGRYAYASPEQFGLFGGKVDARSDIYSLGLVLAAAALGRPLFQSKSNTSLVAQIEARQKDPDLSELPADLRADLEPMLHADPDARPQTMRALLAQARGRDRKAADGQTTFAPLPPARGATPKPPSRERSLKPMIVGGASALALIALAVGALQSETVRGLLGISPANTELAESAVAPRATEPAAPTAEELAEAARRAAERAEQARLLAEQAAAEKTEAERLLAEQAAAEKAEAERLAAEKAEAGRLAAEKAAAEKAEAERLAAEKVEAERLAAEKTEAERLAAEKAAAEKAEAEQRAAERAAAEKELAERLAAERAAADRALQERLAQEREAAEKALQERLAAEKVAAGKAEAERLAAERAAAEKAEAERLAAEKAEAERLAAERAAAEKAEAERLAAQKAEEERLAAEKAAAERLAAEKAAAEKAEAERLAAEKAAAEKAEAERLALEQAAAEKAQSERLAADKSAASRLAAEKAAGQKTAAAREAKEKVDTERALIQASAAEIALAEQTIAERAAEEKAALERAAMAREQVQKSMAAEQQAKEKAQELQGAADRARTYLKARPGLCMDCKETIAASDRQNALVERLAAERAEAERQVALATADAKRLAGEKAEAERQVTEKTAAQREARERLAAAEVTAENAEAERLVAEKEAEAAKASAQRAESEASTQVALLAVFENSLSADERRNIQRNLKRLALYNGPIDGDIGAGTRRAIRTFQSAIGVEASGYLDGEQMARLTDEAAKAPEPSAPTLAAVAKAEGAAAEYTPAGASEPPATAAGGAAAAQQAFASPQGPRPGESHIDYLLRVAADGDLDAQTELGLRYYQGRDVPKDLEASARWNRMAAEAGDPRAQSNLGLLYMQGQGVRRDESEAVRWFRASAEQGHPQAQFNLGVLYEQGRAGLTRDYDQAAMWYARAAAGGYREADSRLSALLSRGAIKERPKI